MNMTQWDAAQDIEQKAAQALARLRVRLPHLAALIQPEVRMANVELDSLDWVELLCVVDSEFGVRLSETDLRSLESVGTLARFIAERGTGAKK